MYKIYSEHFVLPPGYTKKLFRVMKLTTLMLFIAFMQVSASSLAQKVTLSVTNEPLTSVLTQIKRQTGYDFAIAGKVIDQAKTVTITVKNGELMEVLNKIFEGQSLDYSIEDKSVVVLIKQPSLLDKLKNALSLNQTGVIGIVVDEQHRPISGATVTVKGTGNADVTDSKGAFHLKNVADNATIVISFIGYQKQELPAQADMGIIKLVVATTPLDAVQVIAYGETSRRLTTGNITSVSAKEIENQPVADPLLSLEGRVPGIFITQGNGVPGSTVTVRIQGQNSFLSGNDPLYVIDGVPYISELPPNLGSNIWPGGAVNLNGPVAGSPLAYINPADIESIEILKDAEATSVYGSRAANGAILITTKKGKVGKTTISVNVQNGFGHITREVPELNTQQYLAMRNQAMANDGVTPSADPADPGYAPDLKIWNSNSFTDWQKVLLGNNSHYLDGQGSVSGGTENTQFLVGAGYHRETTVFPGDFADQKASVHFNLNTSSDNKKFKFQMSGSFLNDDNKLPQTDPTFLASFSAPNSPPLYNPDGTFNWAPNSQGSSTWPFGNPVANLLNSFASNTNNLESHALISYQLVPGLQLKSSFGYTNIQIDQTTTNPLSALDPEVRAQSENSANYLYANVHSWIIEPQLNYVKTLAKGKLDVLAGMTLQRQNMSSDTYKGVNYYTDLQLTDPAAAQQTFSSATISQYNYSAIFGRINYNLNDEYLAEFAIRRDGSSRFGAENEFHNFGSAAVAWIFSKESLVQNTLPFLSFGKLKASFGTTGNDQIGDYRFLTQYSYVPGYAYQGNLGLKTQGLPNPYLQWELTKKANFGFDLGFFKDRLLLSANYAINRSSNELLPYPLPIITGYNSISQNLPATVQNTSLEFTATSINIKTKDFNWTTNFNLTIPTNKLVAYPGLATSSFANTYIIGRPITIQRVLKFAGVNPGDGNYQFIDRNGQLTENPNYFGTLADATEVINTSPKFYGGLQNSFSYKSLSLQFLFSFTKQIGANDVFGSSDPGGYYSGNQPVSILNNVWTHPNDQATIQKFSASGSNFGQYFYAVNSNAGYSDASYIRLKNASLSWKLPENVCKTLSISNARLYLQGQNLLTITKYKGMDPETPGSFGFQFLPPLRVITLGIQATF
ncbi:SusC/RagA family TonB-linked outer membrane protein [Mucilaginibacter sp. UR6-11]|uniref:SusC/RagA family TonB-linked outer membrane protein n=1 Tax=Mucilaginibacter sp. UR6-11 TaxID=1435644 RepID=UPI001E2E6400|nr:SusC/RagA family TonB-linked outer membrane protein [Mucilaginibacter sp. UR6-11]MCC8424296.1 SusC/RagA family TonB-linked outer membrane protein [Mucilaginibacter sp. UR6-11]